MTTKKDNQHWQQVMYSSFDSGRYQFIAGHNQSLSPRLDLSTLDPEVKFVWLVWTKPGTFHKPSTSLLKRWSLALFCVLGNGPQEVCRTSKWAAVSDTSIPPSHLSQNNHGSQKSTLESGKVKPLPKIRVVKGKKAQVESIQQCRAAHNCSDSNKCSLINEASGFFFFVCVY